ncbi:dephospho-CoA kinase [Apostasia shenzhenica]|uniref:Dephospho-CoA kinase n=1 Tax=Apostasia shenzhenica TaxID=1088818 RepID=A0A2I0B5A0_9ASPA|nr:dephospho-CoA kinase [Apostasia shenzhenica]
MSRDGISEEEARNRIDAQTSLDWKKTKADIVMDNSGSTQNTRMEFQKVLKQVTGPLGWKEFCFSREGMALVLVSIIIGSLLMQKFI